MRGLMTTYGHRRLLRLVEAQVLALLAGASDFLRFAQSLEAGADSVLAICSNPHPGHRSR